MVSKSTSILMAIGIVAVAAVAIIGLGYAYTASTENAGNTVGSSYITVTQTGYQEGFTDNLVVFNTSNPNGTIVYTFDGTAIKATGAKVNAVKIETSGGSAPYSESQSGNKTIYELGSQTFTLTKSGMDAVPSYTLKFNQKGYDSTPVGTINSTNFEYYIKVGSSYYDFAPGSQTVITGMSGFNTESTTVTISLYLGATNTPPAQNAQPLNGVTFVVTAEVA